MLTLTGITAGYGGGNVLQGVDLHCAERTVTCIVGPNGAGKSTVLRVVSGLLTPSQGQITMDGGRTERLSPDDVLRRGITQVPQSHALFPSMSVQENVLMGGYLIRRDRALFTWPAQQDSRLRWLGLFPILPIDHVYAGPGWATVKVERGPRLGSDHYPVIVTLAPVAPR